MSMDWHNKRGFSLIELLVSLSLFTIVLTIAVGTLLVLIDANTKAQNIQTSMTNLHFALDSMTREIRTGSNYYCDQNDPSDFINGDDIRACVNGGSFLSITEGGSSLTDNSGDHRIEYRLQNNRIERRVQKAGADSWQPITSDDMDIEKLEFYVTGSNKLLETGDVLQPTVTIYIAGTAGGEFEVTETEFDLQTTVTQRQLDV